MGFLGSSAFNIDCRSKIFFNPPDFLQAKHWFKRIQNPTSNKKVRKTAFSETRQILFFVIKVNLKVTHPIGLFHMIELGFPILKSIG